MSFLQRLFGKQSPPTPEHAVLVYFQYGEADLDNLVELCDDLESAINRAGVGEFDGHEIATDLSDGCLYMYGPDADRLYETIKPALASRSFMNRAIVTLRFGPPEDGVAEKQVTIGA